MQYLLAALPILLVLTLMLALHWGGQLAGPLGWLAGLIVSALAFGLNLDVLWVSQLRGLFLSLYVLAVLWPALFLYNVIDQISGIRAMARALEWAIPDRGILLVIHAWAFSGMLEGLAGFGMPIAIVAPMLVGLGVTPIIAVAAVAVGHAWSVTFGDMGVIYQTLIAVVKMDGALLVPPTALMLCITCLLCGFGAARILGYSTRAPQIFALAVLMGGTQFLLAFAGVTPLAGFGAGFVGMVGGVLLTNWSEMHSKEDQSKTKQTKPSDSGRFIATLAAYGTLTVLLAAISVIEPLRTTLDRVAWQVQFQQVATANGLITPAGAGQAIRFLTHPGASIFLIACVSYLAFGRLNMTARGSWRAAAAATWRSASPASAGIFAMVGLAALMEHSGMTLLLAQAMSGVMGAAFPVASPYVGMLGAFATGSNNNSNVLFGLLQKDAALLLNLDPRVLIAAQTTGGSLGSMIAPAKLIVGCSTIGLKGKDAAVLRVTLPYGILIGLAMGVFALILSIYGA
jgi:lactate permease